MTPNLQDILSNLLTLVATVLLGFISKALSDWIKNFRDQRVKNTVETLVRYVAQTLDDPTQGVATKKDGKKFVVEEVAKQFPSYPSERVDHLVEATVQKIKKEEDWST